MYDTQLIPQFCWLYVLQPLGQGEITPENASGWRAESLPFFSTGLRPSPTRVFDRPRWPRVWIRLSGLFSLYLKATWRASGSWNATGSLVTQPLSNILLFLSLNTQFFFYLNLFPIRKTTPKNNIINKQCEKKNMFLVGKNWRSYI